jgi:membrane protein YqaA with SNARE-associated domain
MKIGLRPLYNWVLEQAEKPHAPILLFFVALLEPCLIPIPPDTLLIPMAIARRDRAWKLALVATIGSVIGGVIGYAIGALAMHTVGHILVDTYHMQQGFGAFKCAFNKYGMWIILAKGFIPIPFILVAIASGVVQLNLVVFVVSCTITRGARFFLEAALIYRFGAPIKIFIEKHLPWVAIVTVVVVVLGYVAVHGLTGGSTCVSGAEVAPL